MAIAALKRFVADHVAPAAFIPPKPRGEKVAVVGAGPAGLSAAYHLARNGYDVTVFDALSIPGGMMAVGIPDYRLPRKVLQEEIEYIKRMGVDIVPNTVVGKNITLEEIFQRGYKAIFLGIGAHRSHKLGVPGEELSGVLQGVSFLRDFNLGKKVEVGRRVAVIGGGNTAVDAARTALRLGAEQVTIVYRRSREEMPVNKWEVEEAEKEGIAIRFLAAPTWILGTDRVTGLECIGMELGEPDQSGRRRPIPIPGSSFTLEADTVIAAIGQAPDLTVLGKAVKATGWGTIEADPETCATAQPGVFAGGDAVTGAATVIDAVAAGKRAAESIHRYLQGQDLREGRAFDVPKELIAHKELSEDMEYVPRQEVPTLPITERRSNFREVELGLSEEMARREAERCLDCAACAECLQCEAACGPKAIRHQMKEEYVELEVGAIILATGHEFYKPQGLPQYHYGRFPNIIDSMEFERMCNAAGPTGGEILLADGRKPESVAFIHCVGCRDAHSNTYCSRLCCMHAMKQAHLVKEKTGADVYELYIDIRAGGKGYEEFYERVQREGVIFIRGRGAEVIPVDNRLVVKAEDTGLGRPIILPVDLVVLVTGMVARADTAEVAKTFHVTRDKDGFFLEAHPKLRPFHTNTDGIFLAGTCQGPKDIPDTVAHANAAAAEALVLLGRGRVTIEPIIAEIDPDVCAGCKVCVELCAYSAIEFDAERKISQVNGALCKGCGVCVAACPSGAAQAKHFNDVQIMAEIEGVLA